MKWLNISKDEQETIITFDYYDKIINVYTSRGIVAKKLTGNLGTPDKKGITNNMMYSNEWNIPFTDRTKIRKALSLQSLLMIKKAK